MSDLLSVSEQFSQVLHSVFLSSSEDVSVLISVATDSPVRRLTVASEESVARCTHVENFSQHVCGARAFMTCTVSHEGDKNDTAHRVPWETAEYQLVSNGERGVTVTVSEPEEKRKQ